MITRIIFARGASPSILVSAVLSIIWLANLIESPQKAFAYPPGVGILGSKNSCLDCHVNNGRTNLTDGLSFRR